MSISGIQHRVSEWSFASTSVRSDPFNEVELDVVFTGPDGEAQTVPAFWAGDECWTVRFAPSRTGRYAFQTVCSDTGDTGLHERTGTLDVSDYSGHNPLYRHGALRVADDKRHFEHGDGTPFFWLADTWWSGLATRFRWPEDFQELTADRVQKGFSVIQICAAFPPIMGGFDPRAANEAGFPWAADYARINPAYFDLADLRIYHLVEKGLVPCIFGAWGYNLNVIGVEKTKQLWRYIVARWGAYPVVWSLAGETNMPWYPVEEPEADQRDPDEERWYLSERTREERTALEEGWTEVGRYVRQIDPYQRLLTTHPNSAQSTARQMVTDPHILDFDMFQTGHPTYVTIPHLVNVTRESATGDPPMPVLNGEPSYEGVFGDSPAAYQRFQFWASLLSGSVAGYTYGAAGIWQMNTHDEYTGRAPHGDGWAYTPWDVAAKYPGSRQLGLAKKLLMQYEWWRIEPHQEWITPRWEQQFYPQPFAAGVPGELRFIYFPANTAFIAKTVHAIEADVRYTAFFFDPITGERHAIGAVNVRDDGSWFIPQPPFLQDWIVVMEREQA